MGIASKIVEFISGPVVMENQAASDKARAAARAMTEEQTKLWHKDVRHRKPRDQQNQLNIAMVMGNQWVGWNGSAVQTLAAPSWRIQNVDNKIFPRVRSKMARLIQDMDSVAIPESGEFIDMRRAEYKEWLLKAVHREIGIRKLRWRAAQWVVTCGECYVEVYWNESAGDTFAENGAAPFSEGEVGARIWDPFAAWPGAGCSSENNGGRLWTVDISHVELARLKYGDKEISPDATEASDVKMRENMHNFFSGGSSRATNYDTSQTAGYDDGVMIKTLREYRTAALPEGRKTVIINGKVYDEQPLLWDGMQHIINYPGYSGYHGDPVEVRNSIQQQKSYNRLRSNVEEYVRTMAKGKILVHKSLNIKNSQFDSENMEIVRYDGSGPPPSPWMPPPMPNDSYNLMNLCVASIDDQFSDHMASQGKAPASASGSAINYLSESDASQHTASRQEWNAGWERVDEKILDVVAGKAGPGTGYQEGRVIAVVGESRRPDIKRLDPDMIAGRNRVYIVSGGALPENKTLRAEVAGRMFERGALGDPTSKETRRKYLRMVDAGIDTDVYDDEALDEIRAEWENDQMALGVPVPPRPEDDDTTHLISHFRHMKTDQFLRYPPNVQKIFYDHVELTQGQIAVTSPAGVPQMGGAMPQQGNPSAAMNPVDMLKSVQQGAEPPPAVGAPGPEMPMEQA